MSSLDARLKTLKARDVMTHNTITLQEKVSLAQAVATLEQRKITGAPVVDPSDKLVGMLSLWDIVRTHDGASILEPCGATRGAETRGEPNARQSGNAATVGTCMSRNVGTVAEDQSLVNVARTMCEKHWHRVPVVDKAGRLLGIVSTMDVLAAFVNAFDESTRDS